MRQPSAVILNDTATRYHHGCARVMRLLVGGLEAHGFRIAARSPARHDWAHDDKFLERMRTAQVIVINGEGTLHDGAEAGARLLAVVDHPARGDVPVALVNALYEGNPPEWGEQVSKLALVAARDSKSAAALTGAAGFPVRWLPDLSLSAAAPQGVERKGLVVGDSVRMDRRRALARAAQRLGATYLPTKTLRSTLWRNGAARKLLWRGYNGVWTGAVPPFEMATDEADYLRRISAAEGHVTGRFHAVCLSMLTGTPFLALASTTSKIETLIRDTGLAQDRLLSESALDALTASDARRPLDATEKAAIAEMLERARTEAARLFADIRSLA